MQTLTSIESDSVVRETSLGLVLLVMVVVIALIGMLVIYAFGAGKSRPSIFARRLRASRKKDSTHPEVDVWKESGRRLIRAEDESGDQS